MSGSQTGSPYSVGYGSDPNTYGAASGFAPKSNPTVPGMPGGTPGPTGMGLQQKQFGTTPGMPGGTPGPSGMGLQTGMGQSGSNPFQSLPPWGQFSYSPDTGPLQTRPDWGRGGWQLPPGGTPGPTPPGSPPGAAGGPPPNPWTPMPWGNLYPPLPGGIYNVGPHVMPPTTGGSPGTTSPPPNTPPPTNTPPSGGPPPTPSPIAPPGAVPKSGLAGGGPANQQDIYNALATGNSNGIDPSQINPYGSQGGNQWNPAAVSQAYAQSSMGAPPAFAQAQYQQQGLWSPQGGWTPAGLAMMKANSGMQ